MNPLRTLAILLLLAGQSLAAGELQFNLGETGKTVYAVVWDESGQAWNGSAFATYTTTRSTWDIGLTEVGTATGLYKGDFPTTAAGRRRWEIFVDADGGTPSHTDDISLATGMGSWNGTAFVNQTGDSFARLGAPAGASVSADIAGIESGGGGAVIPTNQTRIPPARKWTLKLDGDEGLIGDKTIAIKGLSPKTFSVDFAIDLATNGQLTGIDEVRIITVDGEDVEDDSGLTFDDDWQGVDRSEAKLKITPVAEATYEIAVTVSYDDNDGGGSATGIVTLKVTELPEAP